MNLTGEYFMSKHHENKDKISHIGKNQLQKEIVALKLLLNDYKITFSDLTNLSPREAEKRQDAIKVAKIISENVHMMTFLQEKKKLPIKELQKFVPICHKTLKKYRIYIIALALLFIGEFTLIKEYLNLSPPLNTYPI
jgi:RNA polymerase sigma factor